MSEYADSFIISILKNKRARNDLAEIFAEVTDFMDLAIWELDTSCRIVSCNQKARNTYGNDIAGKYCFAVCSGSNRKCPGCPVIDVLRTDSSRRGEKRHVDIHGNQLYVEHFVTPIHDEEGAITGVFTLLVDITHRKATEDELRWQKTFLEQTAWRKSAELAESEKKFALAFEASPDAININRLEDGLYVEVNKGFTELTGFTAEEVVGRSSLDIHIWHNPDDRKELVRRLQIDGFCDNLEAVFRRKDGSLTTALMSARILSIDKEKYIISITRDIGRLKHMEKEIAEQKTLFETMFNTIDDGIVITDTQRRIQLVNEGMLQTFGYSRTELIGNKTEMLYSEEQGYADAGSMIFSPESIPEKMHYVKTYRNKNGRGFHGSTFAAKLFNREGQWIGNLGIIRDITQQQKNEAERDKLISAIQQTDESIIITDADGRIEFVNDAFLRITGYSGEEVIGENPRILKSGEHDAAFYADLWNTISNGDTFNGRLVNKRKDGTFYTEEASISPVFAEDGRIINYVGVKRDITNQLLMERQLLQAQKMESIGRLTGGVAHDFNNILGIIHGYAELALEKVRPGDSIHDDLETILDAAGRSAAIIRQLLAFSRQQTAAPEKLDLNETVEGMLKMLERLIGENIHLQWFPSSIPLHIKIDSSQVDQILANLCVNAKDAIDNHGTLTIETNIAIFDEAYCSKHMGFQPGEYAMLAVSDDGRGIAQEDLEHVYEPFFTTKKLGRGTGLGLATVYGIVKQNEGFINIYSEVGEGTTIRIYLPFCREDDASKRSAGRRAAAVKGRERILLVEDDAAIRRMIKIMLEKMGYTVCQVEAPTQALQTVKERTDDFHLLLTDVILPEMNGKELAGRIREYIPDIRCLYMSGYTTNVIINKGVLAKGLHFIQKPFSRSNLGKKIKEALGYGGEGEDVK